MIEESSDKKLGGKRKCILKFLSEEELEQSQATWRLASHEVHTVNSVKLISLSQFHHHLKYDLPNMSPPASESFCHVLGQVPTIERIMHPFYS